MLGLKVLSRGGGWRVATVDALLCRTHGKRSFRATSKYRFFDLVLRPSQGSLVEKRGN